MARQRLSLRRVTETAMALVDGGGIEALNLSSVAERLGVGPSALYTHVDGFDGLRYLVAVEATQDLTGQVRNAAIGVAGDEALRAVAAAYRDFARGYPGRFASLLRPPMSSDGVLARATHDLLEVFTLVYRGNGLDPAASALAAGSTHCAIHGFLALEWVSGTSTDHEARFEHLLDTLTRGLGTSPTSSGSETLARRSRPAR